MFLVFDESSSPPYLVFTWENPREDDYGGEVLDDVSLVYENGVDEWPLGEAAPEPCVGTKDHKRYEVFRGCEKLRASGYAPVPGMPVVLTRWSDFLRLVHPEQLNEERWYDELDKLDEAARRRRKMPLSSELPSDATRDEVAAWIARRHFIVDTGVREIWYLRDGAPNDDIRLIEVNDRIIASESRIEAVDFGLNIEGVPFKLYVADVNSEQLALAQRDPSRLPEGWSLAGAQQWWRRGA